MSAAPDVTVRLRGPAAKQMVRKIASNFALLSIQAGLTDAAGTVNAPWRQPWMGKRGETIQVRHRRWLRTVEVERRSYRDALASILPEVPPPPAIAWPPYKSADGLHKFSTCYAPIKAHDAAKEYAAAVVARVVIQGRRK
jgi:hypothetical protein